MFSLPICAASFDCNKAGSSIEKMICKNAEISSADETLAKRYGEVKSKAKRPDLLTNNQLEWLTKRNNCQSEDCVLEEYKNRIEFVNGWLDYEEKTLPKPGGEVQCTDRPECWPEGSAMHTGLVMAEKRRKISHQLETKHAELIALLAASPDHGGNVNPDSRIISALKKQQPAWEEYTTEECELIGSLTGAGGSWPSTYATRCKLNLMEERLRRINSSIKCIQKIPLEARWMDQSSCLQQLAPLANKV
ncbi:lysozyme inhibitor LprI family protein [Cellvibrio sp. ARAG 10.3]|uniref:lysozyme inhibitor LprI family protein n=1 Tax=Cellvibrio sp. ARAG 10.3 TaxID=3451358 RepID=UPI003F4750B8